MKPLLSLVYFPWLLIGKISDKKISIQVSLGSIFIAENATLVFFLYLLKLGTFHGTKGMCIKRYQGCLPPVSRILRFQTLVLFVTCLRLITVNEYRRCFEYSFRHLCSQRSVKNNLAKFLHPCSDFQYLHRFRITGISIRRSCEKPLALQHVNSTIKLLLTLKQSLNGTTLSYTL